MTRMLLTLLTLLSLAGCSATVHQAAFTGPYAGVTGGSAAAPRPAH